MLYIQPLDTLRHKLYTAYRAAVLNVSLLLVFLLQFLCLPPLPLILCFIYSSGHISCHARHQKIKADYFVMDESKNMASVTGYDSKRPYLSAVNLLRHTLSKLVGYVWA